MASTLALNSLSPDQLTFLNSLPKAELHAHLNGSIPLATLQSLAKSRQLDSSLSNDTIKAGLRALEDDLTLEKITDFFDLFPAIYALTSTPENVRIATEAVLADFLLPSPSNGSKEIKKNPPQCTYLELRTTPRQTTSMTKRAYLLSVLGAMEKYTRDQCNLIVSIDWRMNAEQAMDTVELAIELFQEGERVVGVDLCGNFQNAKLENTMPALQRAKVAGLPLTVHIAEASINPPSESTFLLSLHPSRLGHATFLPPSSHALVLERKTPIELCLSSNLLCKTIKSLEDHHITYWLERDHPVCICTDDTLPFRTTLLSEYALLFALPPLGLGLSEEKVRMIAGMSMDASFWRLLKKCSKRDE